MGSPVVRKGISNRLAKGVLVFNPAGILKSMNDIEQHVSKDGTAIASGRDTNLGYSAEQVMDAIAKHIPVFGAIAREIVDAKNAEFKEQVFKKIADNEAKIEAFGDPGFIDALRVAQNGFAKTNDLDVGETLINLIARRSKEEKRTRQSLTLEQCLQIASELTVDEFSELALCFLFRYTIAYGIADIRTMSQYLNSVIDPFIDNISLQNEAYNYLEAQRCATMQMTETNWYQVLMMNYSSLFSSGFSGDIVAKQLNGVPEFLITPCLNNKTRFQLEGQNAAEFTKAAEAAGVSQELIAKSLQVNEAAFMSAADVESFLSDKVPNFTRFINAWSTTPLRQMKLTSAGIAIGHSYAISKTDFNADLGIWIK